MFSKINSVIRPGDIIDIHVHVGGPENENPAMYYWTDEFKRSLSFEAIKFVTRLSQTQVTGPRYISTLYSQIKHSKYVDKIVLLALDQVYTEDGQLDQSHSHLFVSNEYIAHLAQMYEKFLFGCSVHPYAPDAIERLWWCAESGAVLCKWIPSSQSIDPTHPLSRRFYRTLATLNLPLLLHVGPEEAIPSGLPKRDALRFNSAAGNYAQEPGDAIQMALDEGATIIVAHAATPLGPILDPENDYWESVFTTLIQRAKALETGTRLYADMSAFCLPGRYKYIRKIMPFIKEHPHRFYLGSDYPIPIISFNDGKALQNILEAFGWLASRALPSNDFDKNYRLLRHHFSEECFKHAPDALRNPQQDVLPLRKVAHRIGIRLPGERLFSLRRWMHPKVDD
ncbi:amidohydrolase family protein [candidate division KSB1 bacterium]|nr:amidohydrolase family protein [candidate division KSB1 bacterium]